MSDRHCCALCTGQSFNLGTKLLRQRLDDARTEPAFWLSKDPIWPANPVVNDRKLPIRSLDVVRDGDLTFGGIAAGERMLQGIHDEFGSDQAETLGLARPARAAARPILRG